MALLALCGAVLDFAWLYAWAAFSMISLGSDAPAPSDAAAIFTGAAPTCGPIEKVPTTTP